MAIQRHREHSAETKQLTKQLTKLMAKYIQTLDNTGILVNFSS